MHEETDVNSKGIFWCALSLCLGLVASQLVSAAVFFAHRRHDVEHDRTSEQSKGVEPELLYQREAPPAPRLQINAAADLQNYLAREKHLLSSYGWIDKKNGVARIPIERAMGLLAHRTQRGSHD